LSFPVEGVNVTPVGNAPVSLIVGAGNPVTVTVNVAAAPTVKVVLFALVTAEVWFTVSVKFWVASVPAPLWAVIVKGYVPPLPDAGVPLSVAVAAVNVTPLGSTPVSMNVGAGKPVAVTGNVPAVPTVKVVLFALVIAGARFTVSVKLCTASAPAPLCAVNVMEYVPAVPVAGVPLRIPVAALKVSPLGSAPVSVSVGAGVPVAVTANVPATPTMKANAELFALVIVGAGFDALFVVQPAEKRLATRAEMIRVRSTRLRANRQWVGSINHILELRAGRDSAAGGNGETETRASILRSLQPQTLSNVIVYDPNGEYYAGKLNSRQASYFSSTK
jgi:hypothetical protein